MNEVKLLCELYESVQRQFTESAVTLRRFELLAEDDGTIEALRTELWSVRFRIDVAVEAALARLEARDGN